MLLRIAYCDDEIENGKKIRDYINQLMIQIEVEFELDFYVSGTVLLENVKKQNDYYDMVLLDMETGIKRGTYYFSYQLSGVYAEKFWCSGISIFIKADYL